MHLRRWFLILFFLGALHEDKEMDSKSEAFVRNILGNHNNLTLATVRPDGYPQATTVSYVNDGLTIYVGVNTDSQKANNIRQCNKVSVTVDHDESDWDAIKALSMGGKAEIISDADEIMRIGELMYEKFPQARDIPIPDPTAIVMLKITPEVISILDYEKGFGYADLVTV